MSNTTDDMEAFHRGAKSPGAPCPFPAGSRAAHWFQLGQQEPQRPPQEPVEPWNEPAAQSLHMGPPDSPGRARSPRPSRPQRSPAQPFGSPLQWLVANLSAYWIVRVPLLVWMLWNAGDFAATIIRNGSASPALPGNLFGLFLCLFVVALIGPLGPPVYRRAVRLFGAVEAVLPALLLPVAVLCVVGAAVLGLRSDGSAWFGVALFAAAGFLAEIATHAFRRDAVHEVKVTAWVLLLLAAATAMFVSFTFPLLCMVLIGGARAVMLQKPPPPAAENESLLQRAKLLSGQGLPVGLHPVIDAEGNTIPNFQLTYPGDRHSVIFGPIGSGKFRDLQAPVVLTHPGSLLALDLKGQIWATCREARRALGHTVKTINPDGIFGQPSCTYNPLRFIDPSKPSFVGQVQRIVEGFIPAGEGSGKFFSASADDYVSLIMSFVVWKRGDTQWPFINNKPSPPDMSLNRVWQLICLPDAERMAFMDVAAQCDFQPIALAAPRYGIASKDSKEVRDSIATARVECRVLNDPAIAAVLRDAPDGLSFADMKRRKETVCIMVPPHMVQARAKFMRLMVMCAFNELIEETAIPPGGRVLFMLDEFAQLGPMPLVENAASIIRDYKIALQVVLQNRGQIDDLYGDNRAESFLSSAGIVQVLTPNDMKTADWLSRRSGTKKVMRPSFSTGSSIGPDGRPTSSSGQSFQETEEPNWKPHEILELRDDQQLLVVPGIAELIRVGRMPYYEQPHLKAVAAPDPYHMSDEERAAFEAACKAGRYDYSKPA